MCTVKTTRETKPLSSGGGKRRKGRIPFLEQAIEAPRQNPQKIVRLELTIMASRKNIQQKTRAISTVLYSPLPPASCCSDWVVVVEAEQLVQRPQWVAVVVLLEVVSVSSSCGTELGAVRVECLISEGTIAAF